MSAAVVAATSPAAELSALLGLRCFGCGIAEVTAVAPGLEHETVAGFTYQRGQDVRGWCARCHFKKFGPREPTIMDWLAATQHEARP